MQNNDLNELQSLAQLGNVEAIKKLAKFYYDAGNYNLAFQCASRFTFVKDIEGYRLLAKYYEKGIGVEIDLNKALYYYQLAFDLGDYVSGYLLALRHVKDNKYDLAIKYLPLGVYNDYVPSIKLLADCYLQGWGIIKNHQIALNLYEKLLSLGENRYNDQIGKIYYQDGDYYKAFTYFEKGANLFDLEAIYHLAICYAKGQGTALDNKKAIYYYEIGEKNNHPKCIYNLAIHYQKGIGVNVDLEKANMLFKKYQELK